MHGGDGGADVANDVFPVTDYHWLLHCNVDQERNVRTALCVYHAQMRVENALKCTDSECPTVRTEMDG